MADLQMHAAAALWKWAEEQGGLAFSASVGYVWSDTSARIDSASWITDARSKILHDSEEADAFIPGGPDFLINILYDATQRQAIEARMQDWMSNGARLAWMIDLFACDVIVYRPNANPESLLRPDWVEAESVVTGFRLETAKMWATEE